MGSNLQMNQFKYFYFNRKAAVLVSSYLLREPDDVQGRLTYLSTKFFVVKSCLENKKPLITN